MSAPATCDACVELGKTCIREAGAKKTCKDLFYKKGKCVAPCVNTFNPGPNKCSQCDSLGPRCVKKFGYQKKCKNLEWSKKKGCPENEE